MALRTKTVTYVYCENCTFRRELDSENEQLPTRCPLCNDNEPAVWSSSGDNKTRARF
jgi:hypothetical protein